eukprot:s146_g4.t1
MRKEIPVSVSPQAFNDVIRCMRFAVPSETHESYADVWGTMLFCLECVGMWAVRHGSYGDRAALQQMHALLLYGQWEACPLDLQPHPKLLGFCLLPAILPTWEGEWEKMLGWAVLHLYEKLTTCRKLLSVLAWHLSMRQTCRKELARCVRCGQLVRQAERTLRAAGASRSGGKRRSAS